MTKTNTKLAVTVNIAKLKRAANCNRALLKLFLGLPYSEKSGISKLFLDLKSGVINENIEWERLNLDRFLIFSLFL